MSRDKFGIMSSYANEIERIIDFYKMFHASNETLPLILIHGPSGSGKLRTVEAIAAKLSMHLNKVCQNNWVLSYKYLNIFLTSFSLV